MPVAPAARSASAARAAPSDPLGSLRPRPLMSGAEDAGEFMVFDDVAVFDAHTGDDGTVYDQRLLAQIVENQNRRIRDTGDFVPLVIGHTPENPDSDKDPPVVGLAGPFSVGVLGNEKKRPCIFAKFWVFKDQLGKYRSHPRRSVELWPEDRPEDRYFDPIALLGAETPRRDLGLAYSKRGKPERYEMAAAAPSGTNTFLPSSDAQKKPIKHQEASRMALAPEDIAQLIEALKPTISTLVSEAFHAVANPEPDMDDVLNDPNAMPGADPMADPAADPMAAAAPPPAAPPLPGAPPAGAPDANMPPMPGDSDPGAPGADDDSDLPLADDEEPDRYQENCAPMANDNAPAEASVEKYKKSRDQWKLRYQKEAAAREKAEGELTAAKKQLGESVKRERYAKRLGQAYELRNEGYILEPEDEVDDSLQLSDEQWEAHLARARVRYQKVPLGTLPVERDPVLDFETRAKQEEYAKKAEKVALRYQKDPAKKHIRFAHVLKHIIANKGQLDETRLAQEVA